VASRSRVIGVILTGLLVDATSRMYAIQRCGGTCIVPPPEEAQCPDMPQSVLNRLEVDYRLSVAAIGGRLRQLWERPVLTKYSDDMQNFCALFVDFSRLRPAYSYTVRAF
jgi:hypothetical protein